MHFRGVLINMCYNYIGELLFGFLSFLIFITIHWPFLSNYERNIPDMFEKTLQRSIKIFILHIHWSTVLSYSRLTKNMQLIRIQNCINFCKK